MFALVGYIIVFLKSAENYKPCYTSVPEKKVLGVKHFITALVIIIVASIRDEIKIAVLNSN